jgi:nucleoid DNA-binding protein/competence protein ComGC
VDKKITLQELADVISAQSGSTKRFTDSFLRELVVVIQEYLEKDGIVKVKGLGTFKLLWIEARKSVNVATKETIILPAHYKLSFSPEESVKQELNTFVNVVSGGAAIILEAENEADPIEDAVENVNVTEVSIADTATEECVEEIAEEKPEEKAEEKSAEPVITPEEAVTETKPEDNKKNEESSKKTNKGLVTIKVLLVVVILCLCAYIMIPNIEGKLMSLIKPTIHETKFDVVTAPADTVVVEKDTVKVEVVETEPVVTVDNYTPSIAKNAPTREVVTVIDGSRLTMVAYRAYGHKAFWVYVYDANRDRLKRPSDVEKGMELRIPDLPKALVNSKDQRCLDKAYELAKQYDK